MAEGKKDKEKKSGRKTIESGKATEVKKRGRRKGVRNIKAKEPYKGLTVPKTPTIVTKTDKAVRAELRKRKIGTKFYDTISQSKHIKNLTSAGYTSMKSYVSVHKDGLHYKKIFINHQTKRVASISWKHVSGSSVASHSKNPGYLTMGGKATKKQTSETMSDSGSIYNKKLRSKLEAQVKTGSKSGQSYASKRLKAMSKWDKKMKGIGERARKRKEKQKAIKI